MVTLDCQRLYRILKGYHFLCEQLDNWYLFQMTTPPWSNRRHSSGESVHCCAHNAVCDTATFHEDVRRKAQRVTMLQVLCCASCVENWSAPTPSVARNPYQEMRIRLSEDSTGTLKRISTFSYHIPVLTVPSSSL